MTSLASLESKPILRINSKSGQLNNKKLNSCENKVDNNLDKKLEIYDPLEDVIHSPKHSLLSSTSGYTNYRGLLNLCIILLVINLFITKILNYFFSLLPLISDNFPQELLNF
jgi:hypothetical protein